MQLNIPTNDDIRSIIREELAAVFSFNHFQPQFNNEDEIGGIDLAVRVTGKAKPTIYSMCNKDLIPFSKRGNHLYFSKRELLEWIRSGKRQTAAELQTAAGIN